MISRWKTLYRVLRKPLYQIPGPWYSHFTHYVLKLHTLLGRRMHYVHCLHQKYGDVVRISPNQAAIADHEGFRAIHRIGSGFVKTAWYEDFASSIGIGIFATRDPKDHAARRKLFARAFSATSLRQNCEQLVREKVDLAVQHIREEASKGTCDILTWWMLMTSDIIGQLSFGHSFRLLESGEKNHYIQTLEATAMATTLRYELPWIFSICQYIPARTVQLFINANRQVNAYAGRAVSNLRQNRDDHTNLFAVMLAASEAADADNEKTSDLLSDESIRSEASNFIIAGADTTSNTLTYIIWNVLKRPALQARLQREIEPIGPTFDDATLEKLPLLNAVIDETLRLHGAVPGNLSRVVPEGGFMQNGYFIPGGMEVETQAYTLHRNPEIFPEPLSFDETRWLDPDQLTPIQKTCFCPFGAGSRTCIGVHLARMELRLATAILLKECPGLQLDEGMADSMMEMYHFFLAGPVGKQCNVRLLN